VLIRNRFHSKSGNNAIMNLPADGRFCPWPGPGFCCRSSNAASLFLLASETEDIRVQEAAKIGSFEGNIQPSPLLIGRHKAEDH
jgi:hypothetical protein